MPRAKSKRPTIRVKPSINEPSSYGVTAEFSWIWDGQLYGGLFSLTGMPDQDKLVAEIHHVDPGVEVRNETMILHKVRARVPGAPCGRAAHIIQLARIRDSAAVNMHFPVAVQQQAYERGYHSLWEWMVRMGQPMSALDSHDYRMALEESAHVTFDAQGDAIERE